MSRRAHEYEHQSPGYGHNMKKIPPSNQFTKNLRAPEHELLLFPAIISLTPTRLCSNPPVSLPLDAPELKGNCGGGRGDGDRRWPLLGPPLANHFPGFIDFPFGSSYGAIFSNFRVPNVTSGFTTSHNEASPRKHHGTPTPKLNCVELPQI